jgi:C-terminal processing protease CtpA/Prc
MEVVVSGFNFRIGLVMFAIIGIQGCGGGENAGAPTGGNVVVTTPPWTAGLYSPEADFKNFCAAPRTGIDPFTNAAYPDRAGTAMHEKLWMRSWNNRTYLWYREVADVDPQNYGVQDYFKLLKTTALTDSGVAKDNFHFYEDTASYKQKTQSGISYDYGINWTVGSTKPPRQFDVAYLDPSSPAVSAGVMRGYRLLQIDGVDFVNDNTEAGLTKLSNALSPSSIGQSHTFKFLDSAGMEKTINMTSASVTTVPVMNVQVINSGSKKVGYLQFNTHIANAQPQLISAVQQFKDSAVNELVVDLRYNGGGLLALASQFAYMVSGPNIIQNRYFEKMTFNDKYPSTDPVTGESLTPTGFYSRGIDYNAGIFTNQNLPNLNLSRIIVLTSKDTCSASEAFINGLRGVDMEIIQIGGKTCGKPYGFYPTDNCGTTYFTVQFKGVNAKGFGDYADGLVPKANPQFAADVKGCQVADDLTKALGNTEEGMLKTALYYANNNRCPVVAQSVSAQNELTEQATSQAILDDQGLAVKDPHEQEKLFGNKIYMPIKG